MTPFYSYEIPLLLLLSERKLNEKGISLALTQSTVIGQKNVTMINTAPWEGERWGAHSYLWSNELVQHQKEDVCLWLILTVRGQGSAQTPQAHCP